MSASDDAAQAADPCCAACPMIMDSIELPPDLAARSPRELLDALLAAPDDADAAAALEQRAECEAYLDCGKRCAACAGHGDAPLGEAAAAELHERTRAWHALSTDLLGALVACPARPAQLALLAGLAVRGCFCFPHGRPEGEHFAVWLASPASGAWRSDWQVLRCVYKAYNVLVAFPAQDERGVRVHSALDALEAAQAVAWADVLVAQCDTARSAQGGCLCALDDLLHVLQESAVARAAPSEAQLAVAAHDGAIGAVVGLAAWPPCALLRGAYASESERTSSVTFALKVLDLLCSTPRGAERAVACGGVEAAAAILQLPLEETELAEAAAGLCARLAQHGGAPAWRRLSAAGVVHGLMRAVAAVPPLANPPRRGYDICRERLYTAVLGCLHELAGAAARSTAGNDAFADMLGEQHGSQQWHAAASLVFAHGPPAADRATRAFWGLAGRAMVANPGALGLLAVRAALPGDKRAVLFGLLRGVDPGAALQEPLLPLAMLLRAKRAVIDRQLVSMRPGPLPAPEAVLDDAVLPHFLMRCGDDVAAAQLSVPPPGPPTLAAWTSAALLAPRIPRCGALLLQRRAAPRALADALLSAARPGGVENSSEERHMFTALIMALGTLAAEAFPQPGFAPPSAFFAARPSSRNTERTVFSIFAWRRPVERFDEEDAAPAAKRRNTQQSAGVLLLRREDVGAPLPGCARFRVGDHVVPALLFAMQRCSAVLADATAALPDGEEVPLPLLCGMTADEQHCAFLAAVEFAYTGARLRW